MESYIKDFSPELLRITSKSGKTPFRSRSEQKKRAIHWNERGVMLSAIEFLLFHWDPKTIQNPICLMIGIGDGRWIPLVSKLFPLFNFICYSSDQFDEGLIEYSRKTNKIVLHNDVFTNDTADEYKENKNIFFFCNFKSHGPGVIQKKVFNDLSYTYHQLRLDGVMFSGLGSDEANDMVEKLTNSFAEDDMRKQLEWVEKMNPAQSMLKFRLPFSKNVKDVKPYNYLKGLVYWQLYGPPSSAETRLVPVKVRGKFDYGNWDVEEYEQWTFHHNAITREVTEYNNFFINKLIPFNSPELLNDFDSTAECFILRMYVEIMTRNNLDIQRNVLALSQTITININRSINKDTEKWNTLERKRNAAIAYSSMAPNIRKQLTFRELVKAVRRVQSPPRDRLPRSEDKEALIPYPDLNFDETITLQSLFTLKREL